MSNLVEILIVGKNMSKAAFKEAQADGSTMGKTLKEAGAIGAEALIAIGAESVKMASSYQLATTRLVTSAGEQRSNLKLVQDGMLAMAGKVGISAEELAKAMYYVEAAGFHGADGLKVLQAAAQGAVAEGADVTHVGQALTDVLVDYGLHADQAANYTSKMIEAVAHGKTNLEDFSKAFASIVPAAAATGISFDDVGAALANMTNHGFPAARAAQNLAQALRSMVKPTKPMLAAFAEYGVSADTLRAKLHGPNGLTDAMEYLVQAATRFGKEGTPEFKAALQAIIGTAPGANAALATVGKNYGATTATIQAMAGATADASGKVQGFALVQQQFGQQIRQLDAGFQSLLIRLGLQLIPVLQKFISYVMTNGTPIVKQLGDVARQYVVPVLQQFWQVLQNLQPTAATVFKVLGGTGYVALVAVSTVLKDDVNPALIAFTGFLKDNQAIVAGVVVGYVSYRAILLAISATTALVEAATKGAAAAQGVWTAATWLFRDSEIAAAEGLVISRAGAAAMAAQALVTTAATKAWTAATWLFRDSEIALGVQMYAVEAATKVAAAAQWLWNLAMDANPTFLLVTALAALGVAFYEAYQHSEGFRKFVNDAAETIGHTFLTAVQAAIPVVKLFTNIIIGSFGLILRGASDAFGWIPGIGDKLKQASQNWTNFQNGIAGVFDALQNGAGSLDKALTIATQERKLNFDITDAQSKIRTAEAQLQGLPPSKQVTLLAQIGVLKGQIADAQRTINGLHGKTVDIIYRGINEGTLGPGGSYTSTTGFGYAAGGVVSAAASGGARSGMVLVGEQGPELVKLPSGSSVTPAGGTRRMLAEAGGGGREMRIVLEFTGGDQNLLAWLRQTVRIKGGNVQTALGQGY